MGMLLETNPNDCSHALSLACNSNNKPAKGSLHSTNQLGSNIWEGKSVLLNTVSFSHIFSKHIVLIKFVSHRRLILGTLGKRYCRNTLGLVLTARQHTVQTHIHTLSNTLSHVLWVVGETHMDRTGTDNSTHNNKLKIKPTTPVSMPVSLKFQFF